MDNAVDGHLLDIEHGQHCCGEDEHDGLRDLRARACAGDQGRKRASFYHESVGEAAWYLPASVAKGIVERVGLGGFTGLRDEAVWVESHRIFVNLGVMQEVPVRS